MANPLLTHTITRRTDAEAAAADAAAALDAARAAHDAAQDHFDLRTEEVAGLEADIAAKRKELATTTVPAEAQALIDAIAADGIALRAVSRGLATARLGLAAQEAAFEAALDALTEAQADLAALQKAEAAATADDKTWAAWIAALDAAPLSTLQADAAAALLAPPYTGAQAHVDALPLSLRDLAKSRFDVIAARTAQRRTAAGEVTTEHLEARADLEGDDGAVAEARGALDKAVARLRDHVQLAAERFTAAQAQLTVLGAKPLLTAAELGELTAAGDLKTKGEAAAAKEVALNDAQKTVDEKQAALDKRKRAVLADDPDADVSNLVPEQGELDAALTARDTAQGEFDPLASDLSAWLIIVPDGAWADLLAFYDAEQTLEELAALDAKATLVLSAAGITQEQTDLAAALQDAFEAHRKKSYLGRAREASTAVHQAGAGARREDALTALRHGV